LITKTTNYTDFNQQTTLDKPAGLSWDVEKIWLSRPEAIVTRDWRAMKALPWSTFAATVRFT